MTIALESIYGSVLKWSSDVRQRRTNRLWNFVFPAKHPSLHLLYGENHLLKLLLSHRISRSCGGRSNPSRWGTSTELTDCPGALPNFHDLSTPGKEEEEECSPTASLTPGGASYCSPSWRSIDFGLFQCICRCGPGLWMAQLPPLGSFRAWLTVSKMQMFIWQS